MNLKILPVLSLTLAAVLCMVTSDATVRAEELTLKGCLEKALADNPQIAEVTLGLQAGEAGIDSARGKQWPRMTAEDHARDRKIAGFPIGAHQAVHTLLADMILQTEAAEALLAACAARADETPAAAGIGGIKDKLFASETAVAVTDKAIQVMGSHGYCREYIVERLFRDARGLLLHFKTSELLRQDVAKAALGN